MQRENTTPSTPAPGTFDLEHQWQLYLERVGLKGKPMQVNQYRTMKQCFIGACGQMLVLMRDGIGALPDDEAMQAFKSMMDQVGNFFIKESNRTKLR